MYADPYGLAFGLKAVHTCPFRRAGLRMRGGNTPSRFSTLPHTLLKSPGRKTKSNAMSNKMQKYVTIDRRPPVKRPAADRCRDFGEILDILSLSHAIEQTSRCEQCGIPYCQTGCPLQNNIPDWLKLAAEGRLEEAYLTSQETNTFPEICGRICPHDRLCEGACVLEQSRHGTVTIGAAERYITDTAWNEGWVAPPGPRRELDSTIGIIGSGPAGLAAADRLRRMGYQVHVYDRHDRMGGLMIYGIPNFKLDKAIVERRAALLAEGGVIYHAGFEVGRDATLAELRQRHDAVLIATGVYKPRPLDRPGANLKNVIQALPYLICANRVGLGDRLEEFSSGLYDANGRDVVVIGGGDTAMDCLRTAVRQGARSVKCLYRRNRANMPGSKAEFANAEEEGVEFVWLAAPEAFDGKGEVATVRAGRIHLGVADASGRQAPRVIEGSNFSVKADMVITALGFDAEDLPELFGEKDLVVSPRGTIEINSENGMTSLPGVFAAGDIVRGASLVVWAIRDGRDAADAIDRHIKIVGEEARQAARRDRKKA